MSAHRLRLNQDKTELIWVGSKNNLRTLPSDDISLTLGGDRITVADSVPVLSILITSDLHLDKHVSVVSGKCFFSYSRFAKSAVRSMTSQLLHSFMHSTQCASTTATVCWLVHQRQQQTSSSVSSMLQHESSPTPRSLIMVSHTSDAMSFIGLTSLTVSNTDSVSASTNVYTAWHHNTCLSSAHRSQRCLDVIFALLAADSCILRFRLTRSFCCAAPSTWNCLPDAL